MQFPDVRASWQPETFAEMGASVPFTSPELAGARARLNQRRLEFTLPNAAGRRGICILDPAELGRTRGATVHDRHLAAALAALPAITPTLVRQTARTVAIALYAGRQAAREAALAVEEARRPELGMQLALMRLLVRQVAGSEAAAASMPARIAMEAVAARTQTNFTSVRDGVEAIAVLTARSGLPGSPAAHPALIARLEALPAALGDLQAQEESRPGKAARLVLSISAVSAAMARLALARNRKRLDAVPTLLAAWFADPGQVVASFERLDWVLDGWATPCQVMENARGRRCAAVCEMGLMAPPIPAEAQQWFGIDTGEFARHALRAEVLGSSDWRKDGAAIDLIARNEALAVAR